MHHEHLQLLLHTQGQKGNESETEMEESVCVQEQETYCWQGFTVLLSGTSAERMSYLTEA